MTACRAWVLAGCVFAVAAGASIRAHSARTSEDGSPSSPMLKPGPGPSGHSQPQGPGKPAPNPALDPRQLLEQRLRQGRMEEPTAQGEVSERLDRFYRSPESLTGQKHGGPVGQAER